MRLSRIHLHNYRQHKDYEQRIEGNVIGIVGLNGAGKSNFVRAFRYLLRGEVPKANKAQLLTYRETAGFVEGDLLHEGQTYTIHRGLGSESTWCKGPDDRTIRGITATNEMIMRWFGMDKDIADIVFVEQKELDNVLFADPSVRKVSFQKMCGLSDTNKIYRELGPLITKHLAEDPGLQARLEAAQEQTGRLVAARTAAQAQLKQLETTKPNLDRQDIADRIAQCESKIELCRALAAAQATVEQARKHESLMLDALERVEQHPALQYDDADLQAQAADLKTKLDYVKARQQVQDQLDSATAQLARTPQPSVTPEQLAALKERRRELADMVSTLSGNAEVFKSFQRTMAKAETADQCPLCGSATDTAQIRERLSTELTTIQAKLDKYNAGLSKLNATIPKLEFKRESEVNALNKALRVVDQLTEKLTAYPETGDTDVATLTQEHVQCVQQLREHGEATRQLMQAQAAADQADQATVRAEAKLAQVVERTAEAEIPEDRVEAYRASLLETIGKLRKVSEALVQHETQTTHATQTLATVKLDLEANKRVVDGLKEQVANLGIRAELRQTLEEVRSWFYYENGPAEVSKRVLESMNSDVQTFLQHLDAPFSARTQGADLTYECAFHDGRLTPESGWSEVQDLSGAERSILGVSFRLASYVTFAGKLGILGIDEPTADMDEVNVRNFCAMLDKLREVARSLDLQVMIITHHLACVDHVDDVIRIER